MTQEQNESSKIEYKEIVDKIESEGFRIKIKPYKNPYTFEELSNIVITTEDGELANARNVYARDKNEIEALNQMYNEIMEEMKARLNLYRKLEKIVQYELNYRAEMAMWRDGMTVFFKYKKKGDIDTDTENGYEKMVAKWVKVIFSSDICGNRGLKKLEKVMSKIRKELKRSQVNLYIGDVYDRF